MKTYTKEEFEKLHGTEAYKNIASSPFNSNDNLGERLAKPFKNAGSAVSGTGEYADKGVVERGTRAAAEVIHSPINTAFQVLPKPVRSGLNKVGEVISKPFKAASDSLANTQLFEELGNLEAQGFISPDTTPELYRVREALGVGEAGGQIAGDLLAYSAPFQGKQKANTEAIESNIDRQNRIYTDQMTNSTIMDKAGGVNPKILSQADQRSLVDLPEYPVQPYKNPGVSANGSPMIAGFGIKQPRLYSGFENTGKAGANIASAVRDMIPFKQEIIDHKVAQAFELTRTDLTNIQSSTGNNVGRWLADNNLIGNNTKETMSNIHKITDDNYLQVRKEIDNVPTVYSQFDIPEYRAALDEIISKLTHSDGRAVMGHEKSVLRAEELAAKKDVLLADVQEVKEMLDRHFDLYKATGDVKSGVEKGGVADTRNVLKTRIEDEVRSYNKQNGRDVEISEMNNKVQTGNTLIESIEKRDAPGLKPWQEMGDISTFGVGTFLFGGPIAGAALFALRKMWNTPTMQLRVAKWVDGLDDAQKARLQSQMEKGEIPKELDQFIEYKP